MAHRHLSSTIYHVVRGTGVTTVDGQRLEWEKGDIFVVPPWSWHHHENRAGEDAILFTMDDAPALAALGFYREEGEGA
jgi:gentisate 1,2-dioxygenase